MKAYELNLQGNEFGHPEILYATSERAARRYAERKGLRIVRELINNLLTIK